ncbi:YhbY family RNA-binding protein [Candidatus Woesearchaeota archaeon]|nr:YhbY family RNA-binding protein [Candidatus Woesearchaeota archaeon]
MVEQNIHTLEPTVRIGKQGITQAQISEMIKQLRKRHLIKIKLLQSFIEGKSREEKHQIMEQLRNVTKSTLVMQTGNSIVLQR